MKKRTLLIILAIVLAAAVAVALFFLFGRNDQSETRNYNTVATSAARLVKYVGSWEILLLDKLEENEAGLLASYRVYAVDAMQNPDDFLGLTAAEADSNAALTCIGTASAIFLNGEMDNVRNLEVVLNQ